MNQARRPHTETSHLRTVAPYWGRNSQTPGPRHPSPEGTIPVPDHDQPLLVVPCHLAGAAWAWRPPTPGQPAVLLVDVKLTPDQRVAAFAAATTPARALRPVPGRVAAVRGFAGHVA